MAIEDNIRRAVQEAPSKEYYDNQITRQFTWARGRGDDEMMPRTASRLNPLPGFVTIEQAEEFPMLFAKLEEVAGIRVVATYPEFAKRHQGDHAAAAMQLGARAVVFSAALQRVRDNGDERVEVLGCLTSPLELQTTKLGKALVIAHPAMGIGEDLPHLRNMGYQSIKQVGDLAIARNAQGGYNGRQLPVPRSYAFPEGLSANDWRHPHGIVSQKAQPL